MDQARTRYVRRSPKDERRRHVGSGAVRNGVGEVGGKGHRPSCRHERDSRRLVCEAIGCCRVSAPVMGGRFRAAKTMCDRLASGWKALPELAVAPTIRNGIWCCGRRWLRTTKGPNGPLAKSSRPANSGLTCGRGHSTLPTPGGGQAMVTPVRPPCMSTRSTRREALDATTESAAQSTERLYSAGFRRTWARSENPLPDPTRFASGRPS